MWWCIYRKGESVMKIDFGHLSTELVLGLSWVLIWAYFILLYVITIYFCFSAPYSASAAMILVILPFWLYDKWWQKEYKRLQEVREKEQAENLEFWAKYYEEKWKVKAAKRDWISREL